jgi:hypothetical protein
MNWRRSFLALLRLLAQQPFDLLMAGRPQVAQLVVDQTVQARQRRAKMRFQLLELFLYTRGGRFLQLDAVLQAMQLVLCVSQRLLHLGAVLEQVEDTLVLGIVRMLQHEAESR